MTEANNTENINYGVFVTQLLGMLSFYDDTRLSKNDLHDYYICFKLSEDMLPTVKEFAEFNFMDFTKEEHGFCLRPNTKPNNPDKL